VDRRHEIIVARGHEMAGRLGRLGLGFAAARDCRERGPDVRHLLHPLADTGKIRVGLDAARCIQIKRARLIPVDAIGADDIVEQPTLRVEAAHLRLAALIEDGLGRAIHGRLLACYGGRGKILWRGE